MRSQESLGEAWERFMGLLRKCPNHGVTLERQITIFYNGCTEEIKSQLDFGSDGSFLDQNVASCQSMLEKLASNSRGWSSGRDNSCRVAAATNSDSLSTLTQQMAMLNQKMDELKRAPVEQPDIVEDVNYVHNGGHNRNFNNNYRFNQGGGGYSNNHNHLNFSYGNPNNAVHPPPGFSVSKGGVIDEPKNSGLVQEELLKAILARGDQYMAEQAATNKRVTQVETVVGGMATQMKMFETQLGQIAQAVSTLRQPGVYPSQPEENPKDCKAIHLRSGTTYQSPPMPNDVGKDSKPQEEEVMDEEIEAEEPDKPEEAQPKPSTSITPPEVKVPYPHRLKKQKENEQFSKILDVFRKVHINIPLLEAIQQMPSYFKFLKDVISKKKKWRVNETVDLTENCSAIIQKKLPAKMKDPGSFTISCAIGGCHVGKALCDLGASINLMPLSVFNKLKIGKLKHTSITLQMADRSVSYPRGIVEDLLVKVNDFIFPCEFVVLNMEEDRKVPLILGRPFLATAKAMIDVQRGELTLRLNDESVTFSLDKAMKKHGDDEGGPLEQCQVVDVINECVKESETSLSNHLERIIPRSLYSPHDSLYIDKINHELDFVECVGAVGSAKQGQRVENSKCPSPKMKEEDHKGAVKEETPKLTWWKKKLVKLYLAETKKNKDDKEIIRIRIN